MDKSVRTGDSKTATSNDGKIFSSDRLMIPKHRFDCVNLCLKETKQALKDKVIALEACTKRVMFLEQALVIAKVETALALAGAKDLTATKALIDFSNLKLEHDDTVSGLQQQIEEIKKSRDFLFEIQEDINYILVPVRSGETLNKSIANYVKKTRRVNK